MHPSRLSCLCLGLLLLMHLHISMANPCDSSINYELEEVSDQSGGMGGTGHGRGGIGGTGHSAPRGIGGTGHGAGGIGGTGHSTGGLGGTGWKVSLPHGRTQVIGIVTGFASVCVNGVEVHYDSNTLVENDGQASSTQQLQIGQLVSVNATGRGQEVNAQKISIMHALSGPVTKVAADTQTVFVMGQSVNIGRAVNAQAKIQVGDQLKISGITQPNGTLQATRIDRAPANSPAMVVSDVHAQGKLGGVNISGAGVPLQGMIKVQGEWKGNRLQAAKVEPLNNSIAPGTAVHLQGYAHLVGSGQLQLQGVRIGNVSDKAQAAQRLLIVHGEIDQTGKVIANSVEYVDSQRVLERGGKRSQDNTQKKNTSQGANAGKEANKNRQNDLEDDSLAQEEAKQEALEKTIQKQQSSLEKALIEAQEAIQEAQEDAIKAQADANEAALKQAEDAIDQAIKMAEEVEKSAGQSLENQAITVSNPSQQSSRSGANNGGRQSTRSVNSNVNTRASTATATSLAQPANDGRNNSIDSNRASKRDPQQRQPVDKTLRRENPAPSEKQERVESMNKPASIERLEKNERVEKNERLEKIERVEKIERTEKIERPEKIERVERIERPEKVERPDRVDKPEKIERSGKN